MEDISTLQALSPSWSETVESTLRKILGLAPDAAVLGGRYPFPLRALAPDILDYLTDACNFTARDIRHVSESLSLSIDPRDKRAFLELMLPHFEAQPWAWAWIEIEMAQGRAGFSPLRRLGRAEKEKVSRLLSKFPIYRLQISKRSDMIERLSELGEQGPYPADLVTSLFLDCAVRQQLALFDEAGYPHMKTTLRAMVSGLEPPVTAVTPGGSDLAAEDAPGGSEAPIPAEEGIETRVEKRTRPNATLHLEGGAAAGSVAAPQAKPGATDHDPEDSVQSSLDRCLARLRSLVSGLDVQSDAESFELLRTLSAEVADLAEEIAEQKRREAMINVSSLAMRLAKLDHFVTFDALRRLSTGQIEGLVARIEQVETAAAELKWAEEDLSELRVDMARLMQAADLDTTAMQELTVRIAAADARRKPVLERDREARGDLAAQVTTLFPEPRSAPDLPSEYEATDPARPGTDVPDPATANGTPLYEADPEIVELVAKTSPEPEVAGLPDPAESIQDDPAETPATDAAPASEAGIEGPDPRLGTMDAGEADLEQDHRPLQDQAPLRRLLAEDLPGLAAEIATEIEEAGGHWGIDAATLRVAAATRIVPVDHGSESDTIRTLVNRAMSRPRSDLGSVLLFGALVRPVSLRKSLHDLRTTMPELCRGTLGPHLLQVAEAVTALDYDFPPGREMMARLAGAAPGGSQRKILQQLGRWCETVSRKTSRWAFVSQIMHHLASDAGPIGQAWKLIQSEAADAIPVLRALLGRLATISEIETFANEYAIERGKMNLTVHSKGLEYLDNLLEEPRILISDWIEARELDASAHQKSEARLQQKIANLRSRLDRAMTNLEAAAREKTFEGTVAAWVARRLGEVLRDLQGQDMTGFSSLDEALRADLDLLPAALRERETGDPLSGLLAFVQSGIPGPEAAVRRATSEGAFETASRIAERYGLNMGGWIQSELETFAGRWIQELTFRERQLKTIAKVDYDHQEEISRHLDWCVAHRLDLSQLAHRETIADFVDFPQHMEELDQVVSRIEAVIRLEQSRRISRYRNEQNSEDAQDLLAAIDTLTVEAIEDRIAQLRDGRSAAAFDVDLEGTMGDFTESFLPAAAIGPWPHTLEGYRGRFAEDGLLHIEEDRRGAASDFIGLYLDLQRSLSLNQPNSQKLRLFLEEIGFQNVKLSKLSQIGRAKAWHVTLDAQISSDGWFLPPIFGSLSKDHYTLILVGADTLPEAIQKSLVREGANLLLVSGVADLARRREFAERLRSNAIPALLIDEALVAYTATRRETRAQTIFECGLPYGRVEPYTTDPGGMPEEMFFGREQEIQKILSKGVDGCLVYGGRQLGKSALLAHIAKIHHSAQDKRIVVRREVKSLGNSEKTSAIWSHLHMMLSEFGIVRPVSRDYESVNRDIRAWIDNNRHGRILCLFDETDHFMTAETRDDYPELSRLKELMEDTGRAFKVVFAGLHNVKRIHRQPNSPLAHLGEAICIGPLNRTEDDKRAAHDLVVKPMRAAGFKFESNEAVEEILAWANYYPSLVQEYAKGLLATLHGAGSGSPYRLDADGPLWAIPSRDLFAHRGFQQIETRVREKFHLTLELDPRYALVAYTLAWLNVEGYDHQALVSGFAPSDILDHAKGFWPKMSQEPTQASFEVLLDELFELGVLGRVPVAGSNRYTYCLRTRQVAAMLGTQEDIGHALTGIHEKEPSIAYDRAFHRRRYGKPGKPLSSNAKEWHYVPLTDLQIERLLSRSAIHVRLVCGLEMLDLSKITASLRWLVEQGTVPGRQRNDPHLQIEFAETGKDLAKRVEQEKIPENTQRVVLRKPANLKEAEQELRWLSDRARLQYGDVIAILLLDALDPQLRDLANRRPEETEYLSAWGSEMLRIHLFNSELTSFDTRDRRSQILQKTGGIPSEVLALVEAMKTADVLEDVLGDWKISEKLLKPLQGNPILEALDWIMESSRKEDYETINDFLVEACGKDLLTLGPDLQATGLISGWNPKTFRIRRSELGTLLANQE